MPDIIKEDLNTIKSSLKGFEKNIKNKTFLVTGGSGFLGSWFCDTLNTFDAKIICVDNFSSGAEKNIEHLFKSKNFRLLKADICSFKINEKIDYIVHMASIASPPLYQEKPVETIDSNVLGTRNMLELARKNNARMLFTSTSEVYGDARVVPSPENYYGYVNSYGPRCMYDEGKRCAEAYCYSYWKKYGLDIRIVRIFNTYGPRLDSDANQYGRALVKFVSQALKNQDISLYSDGKQTRSFCYITDQINGLFRLLLTDGLAGEVVNIGNDKEITILQLVEKVIKLTKSSSKIGFNTPPNYDIKDDPRRRCPNITKARKLLKYEPKISLDQGLKRTVDWVRFK
ncbi:MAG: NAD-dependent epimerase/dehydratase family protein [Candidatus Aenigmatarchaeota archaeon]